MRQLRVLAVVSFLALIVLGGLGAVIVKSILQKQTRINALSSYQVSWAMSFAVGEVQRFHSALYAYAAQPSEETREAVRIRYDILLSRDRLLREGDFAKAAPNITHAPAILADFRHLLEDIEPEIANLSEPAVAIRIAEQIDPFPAELTSITTATLQHSSKELAGERADLARLQLQVAVVAAIGLAILVAAFGATLVLNSHLDRTRNALSSQNARLDVALSNMSQALWLFDANNRLVITNETQRRMIGLPDNLCKPGTPGSAIIEHLVRVGLLAPKDAEQIMRSRPDNFEFQSLRGRVISVRSRAAPDGHWVTTAEDVTEARTAEARIAHLAKHDLLTGLPNRLSLTLALETACRRYQETGKRFALLAFDLDRFKFVNDTMGHAAGDEVLRQVAARVQGLLGPVDIVARVGGDEFFVVQTLKSEAAAQALGERIVQAIKEPMMIGSRLVDVGASVGIAIVDEGSADVDVILHNADLGLYRAKETGRGQAVLYSPDIDRAMTRRRELESDLHLALRRGEFELYFQPFVELTTGNVQGVETLLRWRHPRLGFVSPAEFIPIAEVTGLIIPIGDWVLREACRIVSNWPSKLTLAVNLSPTQFRNPHLVANVMSALSASGLPPERLELEITETALATDDATALDVIGRLRALGVTISLDDFGTGYSSLSYLWKYPIQKIKIDQSFLQQTAIHTEGIKILLAIAGLGHMLGVKLTAEGVETEQHLSIVRSAGIQYGQGWLFGRPEPDETFRPKIAGMIAAA